VVEHALEIGEPGGDYTYDSIDRRITASYNADSSPSWGSDTPNASWCYDVACGGTAVTNGLGRLVEVDRQRFRHAVRQFRSLGLVTSSTQTTAAKSYPFSNYSYDLSGHLNAETYPSGRVVGYGYDSTGRVSQVFRLDQRL
jgi:YD repeat-containing protein